MGEIGWGRTQNRPDGCVVYHNVLLAAARNAARNGELTAAQFAPWCEGGDIQVPHWCASKLYGKARFVICPRFGRIYLAVLQPLHDVKRGLKVVPGSDIHTCLTYSRRVVQVLQPVPLAIYAVRDERPVIAFTYASYQRVTMSGKLGIVLWVPELDEYFYSSSDLPAWVVELWAGVEERDTYRLLIWWQRDIL